MELEVVQPVSFFERAQAAHDNAPASVDADGSIVGRCRKSHIPDGPGYREKYSSNPGDSGFQARRTRYATIGAGICWDQCRGRQEVLVHTFDLEVCRADRASRGLFHDRRTALYAPLLTLDGETRTD